MIIRLVTMRLSQFDKQIIKPDELEKLFELNPNKKESLQPIGNTDKKCLIVEDVLLNPYDVRDFLLTSAYIAGTNNLVEEKTGAPGMQQPIANQWVKPFAQYERELLWHHNICRKPIAWQDFSFYCNVFWPKMKANDSTYRPHVDPGEFAFNYFLSDDLNDDDGTAIYSMEIEGERWMDIRDMERRGRGAPHPETVSNMMQEKRVGAGKFDTWQRFEGDDMYKLEGVVPARFNCISAYSGSAFHSAYYNPDGYPEDHVRYSLVGMLSMKKVRNSFLTE